MSQSGQKLPRAGAANYALRKPQTYSITSSARASSAGGKARANAFAVFKLISSSNLVA
jgi:hypothetical protein